MTITKKIALATMAISVNAVLAISPEQLINQANNLLRNIEVRAYQMPAHELNMIKQNLDQIERILYGYHPVPGPTYPPYTGVIYQAKCEIDDDREFDFGQTQGGTLNGTIDSIIFECQQRALASFGSNSSSGISQLQLLDYPSYYQTAICHIDDDTDFDFGQIIIGRMVGPTTADIKSECQKVASYLYGANGSSGLKFE